MRILVILLMSFLGSRAFATTEKPTLHIPLFVEVSHGPENSPEYEYVPMAKFNQLLVAKGQKAQLEFVDISEDTDFDFIAEQVKVNEAIQAAGIERAQAFSEYVPANWGDKENYTCYRGDGAKVVDIILNKLVDNLYSDQYTLQAWRLGKKAYYNEFTGEFTETPTDDFNSLFEDGDMKQDVPHWANYDESSDTLIMIASIGDDGTDINESVIPHCK